MVQWDLPCVRSAVQSVSGVDVCYVEPDAASESHLDRGQRTSDYSMASGTRVPSAGSDVPGMLLHSMRFAVCLRAGSRRIPLGQRAKRNTSRSIGLCFDWQISGSRKNREDVLCMERS